MNKRSGQSLIGLVIVLAIAVLVIFGVSSCVGAGGMGPTNTLTVTVIDKHIDRSEDSSHYMVNTDKGTFEVNNGLLLGVWNADEIFGKLTANHTYNITTKGNRVVNFFMQEYPYITVIKEAPQR